MLLYFFFDWIFTCAAREVGGGGSFYCEMVMPYFLKGGRKLRNVGSIAWS